MPYMLWFVADNNLRSLRTQIFDIQSSVQVVRVDEPGSVSTVARAPWFSGHKYVTPDQGTVLAVW